MLPDPSSLACLWLALEPLAPRWAFSPHKVEPPPQPKARSAPAMIDWQRHHLPRVSGAAGTCAEGLRFQFSVLVLLVSPCGCGTWTLTESLSQHLNSFSTVSLCRILTIVGLCHIIRWDTLLASYMSTHCACLVMQVAHFNSADPPYQILSLKDSAGWGRQRGCPQFCWLQQVATDCREFNTRLGSAWRFAQRRYLEYRRYMDVATYCLGT